MRKPITYTNDYFKEYFLEDEEIGEINMKKSQFIHAYIEIEKPDENIEEFEGKFVYEGDMQLKES